MGYRPICDTWILARPKIQYYGAYPVGFPERARVFMPATISEPVLHACSGAAKLYRDPAGPAWAKVCPNDVTCDVTPVITTKDGKTTKPDLVWNVKTNGIPKPSKIVQPVMWTHGRDTWRGILIDPPYTEADAANYASGVSELPNPKDLIAAAMDVLCVGGRVGLLHYVWPRPPAKGCRSIAKIGVIVGFGNRERVFSVFEKR